MSSFKQFLTEFEATKVEDTPEFKHVQSLDPEYARKLKLAWDGDVKDYQRTSDKSKFDPVFDKMVDQHQKFSGKVSGAKNELDKLKQLHAKQFPQRGSKVAPNNDMWWHAGKDRVGVK
jgi:hypothetical protein